jgi:hypothetical protein
MREKPGRAVTIRQVGRIFEKSYLKASIPQNAINGFKKNGIYPLDPNIFPEEAFAGSKTTDQDLIDCFTEAADGVATTDLVGGGSPTPDLSTASCSNVNANYPIS